MSIKIRRATEMDIVARIPDPDEAAQARANLTARGLPFSEAHFLRHVRSGNTETVSLYLRAGISPNARLDGTTALAASANAGHFDITRLLLESGADPIGLTEGLKINEKRKDTWERLSSLAGVFTFISSLVVAGVGWYFTNSYNSRQLDLNTTQLTRDQQNKEYQNRLAEMQLTRDQQNKEYQNRLAEMQTVEKMIPHLTKDEPSKRAALIAISALATPTLAAQIAEAYGGQGSIDALAQLATSGKDASVAPAVAALTNLARVELPGTTQPARDTLARVLADREQAIVKIKHNNLAICNGFVADGSRGWIATPSYCLQVGAPSTFSIEFHDGSKTSATNVVFSRDNLLVFLNTGKQGLYEIPLSKDRPKVGGTVIQLAFDLRRNQLGVILGRIIEAKPMSFGGPEAEGLIVALVANEQQLEGTAGAPLLDSEGNAACMTFQRSRDELEQCLAADSIANAMVNLPK